MVNKWFLMNAVAISLALGPFGVTGQTVGNSPGFDASRRPAVPPVKPREDGAFSTLSQAAQNAGLRTCKPLADQVNRYLIGNNPSWGLLVAAPENANGRIFSTIIEIESGQGSTTYTSATYAPYGDTACGVAYDAVTYWKESCAEVSSKFLRELRPVGTLGNKVTMLDGGPSMRMFLLPAGSGCVQIKKEIVY